MLLICCRPYVWNQLKTIWNPRCSWNQQHQTVAMDGQPWTLLTIHRAETEPVPESEPKPEVGPQMRSNPD
jgi:hypothetical protein